MSVFEEFLNSESKDESIQDGFADAGPLQEEVPDDISHRPGR